MVQREACLSGRKEHPAKMLGEKSPRRFESFRLRNNINYKMKAIIFDFDGVIHNTFAFHKNKIEEFAGVNFSEDEFKDIH
jgi:hypothetical protein